MNRLSFAAVLAAVLLACSAGAVQAQDALRVLYSATDEVKLPDGSTARWQFSTTYDPSSGEYVRTVTDHHGQTVERTVTTTGLFGPTADEVSRAERLIHTDPEMAALIAAGDNAQVSGGFILNREPGHACGPTSRCLQFDVFSVPTGQRPERIRYVIVDARTWQIVDRDFDPRTEGNRN